MAASAPAPTRKSIVLRAPKGEVAWTLIDMQGSIEARSGTNSLEGVEFGTLVREVRSPPFFSFLSAARDGTTCARQEDAPKLIMGKMQMEGEIVKLKKPLAIMSLVKQEDGTAEYHTAGVVRQKIVFKARPVPLVNAKPAEAGPSLCGSKRARADEPVTEPIPAS